MSTGRSDSRDSRGRPSGSRDSQRSDRSSERTEPLAGLINPTHRMYRALQQDQPSSSAPHFRPSGYPSPTADLFARPPSVRAPDVRMPGFHRRSPTPVVSATSGGGGGSRVPAEPAPALFYPRGGVPAIPHLTPEGVPIPEDPRHPRYYTVDEAYVYQPFTGMTLHKCRRSSKTKADSSTATSAAGNNYLFLYN